MARIKLSALRATTVALSLMLASLVAAGNAAAMEMNPYQVFAFNDLGMHCLEPDFSTAVILPPFNVVHAQVLKKGVKPVLLTGNQSVVTYGGAADPSGSINTTSKGKTNFWRYVGKLFGASPPVDVGLLGAKMPNATFGRQVMPFDAGSGSNWFTAAGIPITQWDDKIKFNPYPLMNIRATFPGGVLQSEVNVVLPVSQEQHCEVCHATGADAASPGFHGVTQWSTATTPVVQFKENILILHDAMNNTKLMAARPVLCFECHYSAALDLAKAGPNPAQLGHEFMSTAIHRHHGMATPAEGVIPIPDEGGNTCYYCHPGTRTKCLRGAMANAGLVCQDCHGGLLAVAGSVPLKNNGFRRPWIDLPKCVSCHTGDALKGMFRGLPQRLAYDPADPAATPRLAANKRFAEEPNKLFRFSNGHGMACEACHGSPHAEWPVMDAQANDNLTAMQIQGHPGPIIECNVCHGGALAPSLDGPHGLHNVNSLKWLSGDNSHKTFFATAKDQCQACHGPELTGTRLSRAAADRRFTSAMGSPVLLKKGMAVSCSQCHQNPLTKF